MARGFPLAFVVSLFMWGGVAVFVLLCSCAPTLRVAHRCPTLAPQLVDFVLVSAALAYSAQEINAGRPERAFAVTGAGMSVALASNLAECR